MEKIKRSEKTSNEVLGRIGEKRTLLNNILRRKANWIGHILPCFSSLLLKMCDVFCQGVSVFRALSNEFWVLLKIRIFRINCIRG